MTLRAEHFVLISRIGCPTAGLRAIIFRTHSWVAKSSTSRNSPMHNSGQTSVFLIGLKRFIVNTLIVSKKDLIFLFMYDIILNKEVFMQCFIMNI